MYEMLPICRLPASSFFLLCFQTLINKRVTSGAWCTRTRITVHALFGAAHWSSLVRRTGVPTTCPTCSNYNLWTFAQQSNIINRDVFIYSIQMYDNSYK